MGCSRVIVGVGVGVGKSLGIGGNDIKVFDDFFQKKLLPLDKLISKKYDLKNINDAVGDLKNKKIARALIVCV